MEIRTVVQQGAGMTAWRPLLASSKWDGGSLAISFRCDPRVDRIQRLMKRRALGGNCWTDVESLQWSRSLPQSGNQRRIRQLVSPVVNAQPPTAEEVPTAEELKAQLESLQLEASQVRDRYDSSRARFMRLAQVAEQLQQRAVVELKLGNEGNARQLLMEKKKVLSAAERSKRRSQIYELLSSKLSEAIAEKESQLMAALTSTPAKVTGSEEPVVRVIFPREGGPVLSEVVLEQELEEIFSIGVDSRASSGPPEKEDGNGNSVLSVKAIGGSERDGDTEEASPAQNLTGPGLSEASKYELMVEERDSASTVWAENSLSEPSKEETHSEEEVESQLCNELESAAKDLDVSSLQEEKDTAEGDADLEDKLETSSKVEEDGTRGTRVTRMDILDLDEEEPEAKMVMNDGHEESHPEDEEKIETKVDMKLVFEEYLLDIDSQVAGLELKLQGFLVTANIILGSNSEMKDERVVLVKTLLQQIQSLRTRILEGVNKSLEQQPE